MGGRRYQISGTVQGVGFRPWAYRVARATGVGGRVHNDPRGVVIEAFGSERALDAFGAMLQEELPAPAVIRSMTSDEIADERVDDFTIIDSGADGERAISIPPDLATCPACQSELTTPDDRRYGYAFTNCTHCGPRYTIATDIPYDRPATTMASFDLCDACSREYHDPEDRRFHAQPNACPECGPALTLVGARGRAIETADPIADAASLLARGYVVAVKGLGGFHLACDAMSTEVVGKLRQRKRRDRKPFAVMVPNLAWAHWIGEVSEAEQRLLRSPERPIVLVKSRGRGRVSDAVAPDLDLIGLFLPYTPLHHLLLGAYDAPLVMTSANVAGEPIAHDNDEAMHRLGGIADAFLLHNRDIAARCDDSVARVIGGRPVVQRRSRGFVPRAIQLAHPVQQPILACGAHLKNTFCLAQGDLAYLGPHIGDLDTLEAVEFFEQEVERLEKLLCIEPRVIAHDLHPGYASSEYAKHRGGTAAVAVQHHHAHVVSAMAENHLAGSVIGVAYDGTGLGADGAMWGGEVLVASAEGYARFAALRPVQLAGGDQAIREVWRIALALVEDAYSGAPPFNQIDVLRGIAPTPMCSVRNMIETDFGCAVAHGAGRYFDGIGALVLGRERAAYEGQVAMALEAAAGGRVAEPYDYAYGASSTPREIDLRPTVRAVVADLVDGVDASRIAARFHATIVAATMAAIDHAVELYGHLPVVLTGGCFANRLLTEGVLGAAGSELDVYTHGEVPPGDGGLALGQLLIADAMAMRSGR